jgi:thymidylate synthase (FAD)
VAAPKFAETDSAKENTMIRPRVETAEKLIGVKQYALGGQAFVVLVDYMGNDDAVVQAARVSYGKGTKTARDDAGLIRYLMRHKHTTPFEMVEFKFAMQVPIFVARQWIRHRTANVNEYSLRYSEAKDVAYVPEPHAVAPQSKSNRQGREGQLPPELVETFRKEVKEHSKRSYELYRKYLDAGIAKELARIVLPVNFSTEWYWKIDLHNLFHFLNLRLDAHAQYEIREIAGAMAKIVKDVVPVCYQAFEDFTLDSTLLSKKEKVALKAIMDGAAIEDACAKADLQLTRVDGSPVKTGEGPEFLEKLSRIRSTTLLRDAAPT